MITETRSTLDEADYHAPVGSRPWSLAITNNVVTELSSTASTASSVAASISLSETGKAWETLGYADFETYLEQEIEIDLKFYTKLKAIKSPINEGGKSFYEIFRADRTAEAAQEAEQEQGKGEGLKPQGAPTGNNNASKPEQPPENKGDNITFDSEKEASRGTGTKYTLRKFQRDINDHDTSPERKAELQDIYDRIKSKELSVNAGAIAAGYRRKRTPLDTVMTNLPKTSLSEFVGRLSPEQRSELTTLLTPDTKAENKPDNARSKPTKTTATKPRPKPDKHKIPNILDHPGILGNWTTYPDGSEEQAKAVLRGMFYEFCRLDTSKEAWQECKGYVLKVAPWKALGLKDFEETVRAVFGMPLDEVETIAPSETTNDSKSVAEKTENKEPENGVYLDHKGKVTIFTAHMGGGSVVYSHVRDPEIRIEPYAQHDKSITGYWFEKRKRKRSCKRVFPGGCEPFIMVAEGHVEIDLPKVTVELMGLAKRPDDILKLRAEHQAIADKIASECNMLFDYRVPFSKEYLYPFFDEAVSYAREQAVKENAQPRQAKADAARVKVLAECERLGLELAT